jgi:hypothetical protein
MSTSWRFHIWKTMRQSVKISRGESRWVQGTFQVKHVHSVRFGLESAGYQLVGKVSAPGLPPTPVSRIEGYRPSLGEVADIELPVLIDRGRPDRIRIQWRQISDLHQYVQDALHERSLREAEPYQAIPGPNPYDAVIQALRTVPPMDAATFARATPAIAVVTAVVDELAEPGEPNAVLTLELEVSPLNGAARYPARCVVVCRSEERRVQLSTPGTRIPVRIHPDDPACVGIDEEKLIHDRRQQT